MRARLPVPPLTSSAASWVERTTPSAGTLPLGHTHVADEGLWAPAVVRATTGSGSSSLKGISQRMASARVLGQ